MLADYPKIPRLSRTVQKKCSHEFDYRPYAKGGWTYVCTICGAKSKNGFQNCSSKGLTDGPR